MNDPAPATLVIRLYHRSHEMLRWSLKVLLRTLGFQQQILEIETEIRGRRDRFHPGLVDGAIGIEREGDERVGAELAVAPADGERVVLPVFQVADEGWRVREAHRQFVPLRL